MTTDTDRQQSLLPGKRLIEITDPKHLSEFWVLIGHLELDEFAAKKAAEHKVVGMRLLADLVKGRTMVISERVRMMNIKLAVKHGYDFETEELLIENKNGRAWLVIQPMENIEKETDQ